MEKASKNQAVKDALGEPIVKGPWYNASLAVTHKRQTVSCTFPVSGAHGNGVFQLKAVRKGGLCLFMYFLHSILFHSSKIIFVFITWCAFVSFISVAANMQCFFSVLFFNFSFVYGKRNS